MTIVEVPMLLRNDTGRVLREVKAYEVTIEREFGCGHSAEEIRAGECPSDIITRRRLAAALADHPDYREEWRP